MFGSRNMISKGQSSRRSTDAVPSFKSQSHFPFNFHCHSRILWLYTSDLVGLAKEIDNQRYSSILEWVSTVYRSRQRMAWLGVTEVRECLKGDHVVVGPLEAWVRSFRRLIALAEGQSCNNDDRWSIPMPKCRPTTILCGSAGLGFIL